MNLECGSYIENVIYFNIKVSNLMKVTYSESQKTSDILVVGIYEDKLLVPEVAEQKAIERALKNSPQFKGKLGSVCSLAGLESGEYRRVVVLGLGKAKSFDALKAEEAGGKLYAELKGFGGTNAELVFDQMPSDIAAHVGMGVVLRSYVFDYYKSKKTPSKLTCLNIVASDARKAKQIFEALDHVRAGIFTARDLVNRAPNDLYPQSYADFIQETLKPLGVSIDILDEHKMQTLNMGAFLAVGMGSARKPRMVVMRWNGGEQEDQPISFVGKGVTFDTGGISLKPGAAMDEMKMDMGGSAAVVGLMQSLALRQAKVNVVAVVGLAENMPSSNAYRPADILQTYSGKSVEVLNTDAEGRLVLADCLSYVQDRYKPKMVIDLATLTGAIMVALGHEYCGVFANCESLWQGLERSSAQTGEKLWRMPLDEFWHKDVKGNFGDVQNLAKSGRLGGACSAAAFLEHFIEEDMPWAHMDIAGTAWVKTDKLTTPKYGTGFGVRVLNDFVATHYEG